MAVGPKIILVFPGQGSQTVGMGKDFYGNDGDVRRMFEQADEVLGMPLTRLMLEGPEEELTKTENAQPAILTVSVATLLWLKKNFNFNIVSACGHSLGEYSSLVAVEALSFPEALKAVRLRGQLMQKAVPLGAGTMAAILGLEDAGVEAVCQEVSQEGFLVEPANYNCPGQLVISGTTEGVKRASQLCKERGALKVVPLKVSAPFHSSLLKPAGDALKPFLQQCRWNPPRVPYIANVSASWVEGPEPIVELLSEQVWKPVRWAQSLQKMFQTFKDVPVVEVGPGKVIAGHVKKIERERTMVSTDTLACEPMLRQLRSGAAA